MTQDAKGLSCAARAELLRETVDAYLDAHDLGTSLSLRIDECSFGREALAACLEEAKSAGDLFGVAIATELLSLPDDVLTVASDCGLSAALDRWVEATEPQSASPSFSLPPTNGLTWLPPILRYHEIVDSFEREPLFVGDELIVGKGLEVSEIIHPADDQRHPAFAIIDWFAVGLSKFAVLRQPVGIVLPLPRNHPGVAVQEFCATIRYESNPMLGKYRHKFAAVYGILQEAVLPSKSTVATKPVAFLTHLGWYDGYVQSIGWDGETNTFTVIGGVRKRAKTEQLETAR